MGEWGLGWGEGTAPLRGAGHPWLRAPAAPLVPPTASGLRTVGCPHSYCALISLTPLLLTLSAPFLTTGKTTLLWVVL